MPDRCDAAAFNDPAVRRSGGPAIRLSGYPAIRLSGGKRQSAPRRALSLPAHDNAPMNDQLAEEPVPSWQVPATQTAPGSAFNMQVDTMPLAVSAALVSVYERSDSARSALASLFCVEYGRYSCGPPQAMAPTGSVRHCALSLHVGVPIWRWMSASVVAGAVLMEVSPLT
jgi:hypothetical protein